MIAYIAQRNAGYSPGLLDAGIKTKSTVLIACAADGHTRANVVLQLDDLVLGLRDIRGEGNEDVSRDALLDCYARPGILLRTAAAQYRVYGQTRNSRDFFHAAGDLAADLRCDQGLCTQVPWHGIGSRFFRRFSEHQKINNVGGRQRRNRCVIRAEMVGRTMKL